MSIFNNRGCNYRYDSIDCSSGLGYNVFFCKCPGSLGRNRLVCKRCGKTRVGLCMKPQVEGLWPSSTGSLSRSMLVCKSCDRTAAGLKGSSGVGSSASVEVVLAAAGLFATRGAAELQQG
ncbi:hypothetical protein L7F22_017408 [Adiantum nelumboides]|nr:hypothetical protein [Adiantum nelumboides]